MTRNAEQVAAEARTEIDALAARLGTNPVVRQDALINCEFGQDDSGKFLSYFVHVSVPPGTLERLKGEIADVYAKRGWTVQQEKDGVSFHRDRSSIGASISRDGRVAAVGGSGGCSE